MVYAVLVGSAFLIESALSAPLGSLPLGLNADRVPAGAIALISGAGPMAALAVSVPIGGLTDRFGRLPTIRMTGALCCRSVGAITAYATAEFAYASAIVAPERAVAATATLGMVGNVSFAIAPAAGFWLWQHGIGREP